MIRDSLSTFSESISVSCFIKLFIKTESLLENMYNYYYKSIYMIFITLYFTKYEQTQIIQNCFICSLANDFTVEKISKGIIEKRKSLLMILSFMRVVNKTP